MKAMKKLVLLLVVFSFMLVGCENKSESNEDKEIVIYIARHGKTMLNTTDRAQGWADAVLTPPGVEVVEYLGLGLKDVKFDAAYSSDSGRSIQTANIILEKSGQKDLKLITDSNLREFGFGSYEGDYNHVMWGEVAAYHGKTLEEFQSSGLTLKEITDTIALLDKQRTAGQEAGLNWAAEDYDTIEARLQKGLDNIVTEVSKNGGSNVLVVSHGLSINTMITMIDPNYEVPPTGPKNASIAKVTYKNGKYTVEAVNDMSYVEKGKAGN